MSAGNEATALRKHDLRQGGRLLRFGHAKTKTLDHEPVDRGRTRLERRSFGPLGLESRRATAVAGARSVSVALAELGRVSPCSLRQASAGLALAPICRRANT